MYQCKECGAPASVDQDGAIVRSCAHTGTVTMALDAVCRGRGRLVDDPDGLVSFFRRIGNNVMQRMRGD